MPMDPAGIQQVMRLALHHSEAFITFALLSLDAQILLRRHASSPSPVEHLSSRSMFPQHIPTIKLFRAAMQ